MSANKIYYFECHEQFTNLFLCSWVWFMYSSAWANRFFIQSTEVKETFFVSWSRLQLKTYHRYRYSRNSAFSSHFSFYTARIGTGARIHRGLMLLAKLEESFPRSKQGLVSAWCHRSPWRDKSMLCLIPSSFDRYRKYWKLHVFISERYFFLLS